MTASPRSHSKISSIPMDPNDQSNAAVPNNHPVAKPSRINREWLMTLPIRDGAILKGIIMVFLLIAACCVAVVPSEEVIRNGTTVTVALTECDNEAAREWFLFATVSPLMTTLILFFLCLCKVTTRGTHVWRIVEIVHDFFWALILSIAAISQIAIFKECLAFVVAGVFAELSSISMVYAGVLAVLS